MLSYSRKLIRWALVNYCDLSTGHNPRVMDELMQFNKNRKGGNAQQTIIIIKSDIDAAISSLNKQDVWSFYAMNITEGMLLQAGRDPRLGAWQRRILNCIIESCAGCGGRFAPGYCQNWFIVNKMRDYLNGVTPG